MRPIRSMTSVAQNGASESSTAGKATSLVCWRGAWRADTEDADATDYEIILQAIAHRSACATRR